MTVQFGKADAVLGIQRTIGLYGQLLDDLRMAEWGRLFTDDAVWAMPGVVLTGRAEIVSGVRKMEPDVPGLVKHLAFTPIVNLESDRFARAWTDMLFMTRDSFEASWKIVLAGRYCDELVHSDAGWQFALRVADFEPGNLPAVAFERSPSV